MARPIWTGTLSFGLLNIPVALMPGERRVDLHFRMLDGRDKKPIRYERINAETGEEVPWKDIVKAYEYHKGSYVVLDEADIKSAAPESHESIDVETFVDKDSIAPRFFEKPYYLVPGKKAEKGYVLLRETLKKTNQIGIARVVIRTREYLCAVMPEGNALMIDLMRYPQELVDLDDYKFPSGKIESFRVSKAELSMAEQLIESMSGKWKPDDYEDEFRARLTKAIEKRMKRKGAVTSVEEEPHPEETTNVVDFMELLKKSLASNQRTPARKTAKRAAPKTRGAAKTRATAGRRRARAS